MDTSEKAIEPWLSSTNKVLSLKTTLRDRAQLRGSAAQLDRELRRLHYEGYDCKVIQLSAIVLRNDHPAVPKERVLLSQLWGRKGPDSRIGDGTRKGRLLGR